MSVLVLVSRGEQAKGLIHWAGLFGRARGVDVVVLDPGTGGGSTEAREIPLEDEPSEDERTTSIVQAVRRAGKLLPVLPKGEDDGLHTPKFTVVRLPGLDAVSEVIAQVRERSAGLLILGREPGDAGDREFGDRLFADASCPVLLIRPGDDQAETAETILVPVERGPHVAVALELAVELATASGGRVTALAVETQLGEDAEDLGRRRLERGLSRLSEKARDLVDGRVVLAGSVLEGIASEAADNDLVLLGTESPSFIRRVLTRSVPDRVFTGPTGTSVAVVRRALPLSKRFGHALVSAVTATVPQLARADRVALVDRLQSGSRWSFDFILLTCLSTLIASLGLVAGNVAVVIGAMLVAPLMTPLIGAGLALVHGNLVFLRRTLSTVAAGFVLALGIGCLVGLIAAPEMTREMLSRGKPGVVDLAVAFASGLAAAYAIGRPDLSAALPGVAIAAALVPPIATAGVSLMIGSHVVAAGAALLFFTNLVAIVLGSAVSLVAVGVRSDHLHRRQKKWVRQVIIALFLAAAFAVVPLGFELAALARE